MSTSSLSETASLKIHMIDAQYIYSIFQQYMKALADESLNSCNTLANIKTGLEIGKLNEKSDIISVYEMQANANKLLDNVQLNKQKSTEITENIMQIEEIISTEEIVNNSISNKLNCIMHEAGKVLGFITAAASIAWVKGATSAATKFSNSNLSGPLIMNLLGASALTLLSVSIISLVQFNKTYNFKSKPEVLVELNKNMVAMRTCLQKLTTSMDIVIEKLEIYIDSADKLQAYCFQNGDWPIDLTSLMIDETNTLQACFKKITSKATKNSKNILR